MLIEDVHEQNKVIAQLKRDSKLSLKIQPIEESKMRWGVISDTSWGNARGGKRQAGHMLITFHEDLMKGERAVTNLLHWKSRKLQRTVGSTLAAETQYLARGIGDLLWMIAMYLELTRPDFQLRQWRKYVREKGYAGFSKHSDPSEFCDAMQNLFTIFWSTKRLEAVTSEQRWMCKRCAKRFRNWAARSGGSNTCRCQQTC